MSIKLLKSDIHRIGDTVYQNDKGNCVFVFDGNLDAFGIQYIILRSLLLLFGDDYRIVSEDEYWDEKDQVSIYLFTNLPWELFVKAGQEDTEEE